MKKHLISRLALSALATILLASQSFATCGGGGGGGMGGIANQEAYDVPWRRVWTEELQAKDALVVYWFPSSPNEFQRSSLRVSRTLSLFASQCVTMCVAEANTPVGQKFVANEKLPIAILASGDGTVLAKAENQGGMLRVDQVEAMLKGEVKTRSDALSETLNKADSKAQAGDTAGAIADYRSVLEQKCLFPKRAKEAAKKLQKLGATDVSSVPDPPDFDPRLSARIEQTMAEGLKDEDQSKYAEAKKKYEAAHRLDPADPTPLRYLGELYRHDIGDWGKARQVFDAILAMKADPLSRAVALHGLGKMTIHEGQYKRGMSLIVLSLQAYPLAMAYRNLAVYWNSEGDNAKADKYGREALKLDPTDPFNLVFAAVFMAANGRVDEALKVAQDNESLLPASYNLAAIYAQSGQKEKALALLKRHFYTYERTKNVRSKEMMEARVDRVFASLINDKDFLALTSEADGMLPMRKMGN